MKHHRKARRWQGWGILNLLWVRVMYRKAKSFFCVFLLLLPSMTMADTPGQYGANNCPMAPSSGSA
jgi:hypothetical protein